MTGRLGSTTGGLRAVATSAVRTLARAPGRVAVILVLGLGVSALATLAPATLAPAASASADSTPVPFTCLTPTDFLLNGTTLYSVAEPATGLPTSSTSYTKLATDLPTDINALGFDPIDGLLYAIVPESDGQHLLQIDSTGTVTDLGAVSGLPAPDTLPTGKLFASGGFDPSGNFWVTDDAGSGDAWSIDVSASPPAATGYTMSGTTWAPTDWTYADGYLWGDDSGGIYRFDPSTDAVDSFSAPGSSDDYNAAWTFADGALGFYSTGDNSLERITVTDPESDAPRFAVAATGTGPGTGSEGDAASCAQVGITTTALAPGDTGDAYSATLAATGGPTPADYSWALTTASGPLPTGLSLDSSGTISGTPSALGTSTFTVQVTAGGAFPVTATQTYTLTIGVEITTSTLPDGTYGKPYTATLSAASGTTPYTWSVSSGSLPPGLMLDASSGTISGTPTAAGSYSFTAEVTDASSQPQTATQQLTLTVNPAPLTANVDAVETYGGSTIPSFVVTGYTGLVNGDTDTTVAVSGTLSGCLYVPGATVPAPDPPGSGGSPPSTIVPGSPGTPAGTYPGTIIGCSGLSSPNYTITYSGGDLIVNPAPLTITASSASITYGSVPPAITPSYSGFVNGDSAASLTTAPTCSTTATVSSTAGAYPSTCSGAVDPNYAISYVPGTVTIGQATLVITASSGSMTYGGTPPAITASYSGFVNGDTSGSLTTPPTCSTAASSTSPAGSYSSSCSGAVDANYTISYVSGTVTVNPAPLIITAASGSMTYGGTAPTITPSYSGFVNGDSASALTTAPTCTTTATASSPVGSYASSCSGAADANYTISYVNGTVTVTPAALTITASSGSMTYGGTPPTITPSYSGFVNGDTAASLTPAASCVANATSSSPVGSYASSCSGAVDPNYLITYVNGAVTVGPAALTITASGGSMTYGGTPPAITASYSGFVNGDTASSLSTAPTCSTTATASSPAGSYPSTCSGAVDPNYLITYVNGSVTVGRATLTITASSGSMTYGGTAPTITPSYSGFVNGDTSSSLTTAPTCTTTATATSSVGTYTSSCSGAVDANYTISYVPGTVTVGPAGTTIAYTGPASISVGSALVPAASLTSTASGCQAGQPVSFSLNENPTTGATGSYSLGSATTNSSGTATATSVSTSGWEAGAYMITASYAGTANCNAASVTAPLAVSQAGDVAVGAGTYSVSGVGPVAFGFVVWRIPLTSIYLGGISIVGGGWSLVGDVTGYSLTSGTQGVLTGTGTLSWWNPALSHGHGGWQIASTSVSYTATFSVTSKTSPGSFGIQISYTPVAPQPSTLPDSAPMTLKSGLIVT